MTDAQIGTAARVGIALLIYLRFGGPIDGAFRDADKFLEQLGGKK